MLSKRAISVAQSSVRKISRTMATSSLEAVGDRHVNKGLGRLTTGVMAKGEGSWMNFEDGRRMLDFTSGIGVTNLGHCN